MLKLGTLCILLSLILMTTLVMSENQVEDIEEGTLHKTPEHTLKSENETNSTKPENSWNTGFDKDGVKRNRNEVIQVRPGVIDSVVLF